MNREQLVELFNLQMADLLASWSKLPKLNKRDRAFSSSGYLMYMRSHGYADFHAAVHGSLASDIASLKNTAPEFPNGFLTLCERGHVDSTIEGFVVTNAGLFGELFTEEELEAAQTFYNLGKAMRGV